MKKYIVVGLGLVGFDQITKQVAENFLVNEAIVFTDWFRFLLTYNKGIAFSLPFPQWGLIIITIGFLWFFSQKIWPDFQTTWQRWAGVLVMAGAIGNLIDRVLYGAVIDFVSLWSFPIFNVADICISVGVAGLLWSEFFLEKQSK
jgi:signal peptidase II